MSGTRRASSPKRSSRSRSPTRSRSRSPTGKRVRSPGRTCRVDDKVVRKYRRRALVGKSQRNPTALFVVGAPGAGKSTVLESLMGSLSGWVLADPDEIMESFRDVREGGFSWRECIDLALDQVLPELVERAFRNRRNIVIDFPAALRRFGKDAKLAGYRIVVLHVRVSGRTAWQRAKERALTRDRLTYPSLKSAEAQVQVIQKAVDEAELTQLADEVITVDNEGQSAKEWTPERLIDALYPARLRFRLSPSRSRSRSPSPKQLPLAAHDLGYFE